MANLIRSAKSGSQWSQDELRAYNIQIVPANVENFFGLPNLPYPPPVSPAILAHQRYPAAGLPNNDDRQFFYHMQASMGDSSLESSVDTFAIFILKMFGYN